jgi:hypothetical protein
MDTHSRGLCDWGFHERGVHQDSQEAGVRQGFEITAADLSEDEVVWAEDLPKRA